MCQNWQNHQICQKSQVLQFFDFSPNFRFAFKLPSKCAKTVKITKFAKHLKFCIFFDFCPKFQICVQIAFKMCQHGQNHQICQKSQILPTLAIFVFFPKVQDLPSNCLQNVPTRSKSPNLLKILNFAFFRFLPKVSDLPSNCLQYANTVKITKFAKNLKFCIFFDFCPNFQICLQIAFKMCQTVKITKFAKNLKFGQSIQLI